MPVITKTGTHLTKFDQKMKNEWKTYLNSETSAPHIPLYGEMSIQPILGKNEDETKLSNFENISKGW